MSRILTDIEIAKLLAEKKIVPSSWSKRLAAPIPAPGKPHLHRELLVQGGDGSQFCIYIRKNPLILLDFSIILTFKEGGEEYHLLRYDGRQPSDHTNKWEKKEKLPDWKFRNEFHIHMATERYQRAGFKIDGFARVTDDYHSFDSALAAFVSDNGFEVEDDDPEQGKLF